MRKGLGRRAALGLSGLAMLPRTALAQPESWPTRPVRIVVPFTPGGSNDAMARPLSERLSARFGQPFVIENRPGAGSAVGVTMVAQSPPDGYTLLVTTSSVAAIGAVQGTGFDPTAELDTVAFLAKAPLVILVRPDSPFRSVRDIVQVDRARPGSLTYATSGPGSTTHIMTELFNLRAGTRLTHVPYRGTAPALMDVVAGRVAMNFSSPPPAIPLVREGQLRAIAVTGDHRIAALPDVPTLTEAGLPGAVITGWHGVFAPAGVPAEVLERLETAARNAASTPRFLERLEHDGLEPAPAGRTRAQFAEMVKQESAFWARTLKALDIKLE